MALRTLEIASSFFLRGGGFRKTNSEIVWKEIDNPFHLSVTKSLSNRFVLEFVSRQVEFRSINSILRPNNSLGKKINHINLFKPFIYENYEQSYL